MFRSIASCPPIPSAIRPSGGLVAVSNSLTKRILALGICRKRAHPAPVQRAHIRLCSRLQTGYQHAINPFPAIGFLQGSDIPMKIRKAVFPVAGLGTRVLPATKAMPKEMLTIVDKPLIQYVVDEAREAGIEHFIFVTGRNKGVIEDHFDRMYELDATLAARGKKAEMEILARDQPEAGAMSFTRQQAPLGLGHAVWCARDIVGNEPFAVVLPDELVLIRPGCLAQMIEAAGKLGEKSNLIAVEGSARRISPINTAFAASASAHGKVFEVDGMVEKPPKGTAPSNLSITGRYILQPEIFKILETQERGAGGEIQLTDAMIGLSKTQKLLRRRIRRRAARLRLQGRISARQHRLRPGARRFARWPARGDEEVSGEDDRPLSDERQLRVMGKHGAIAAIGLRGVKRPVGRDADTDGGDRHFAAPLLDLQADRFGHHERLRR
jgi:UTP--glucose-1-phosphate uridylyltransferase